VPGTNTLHFVQPQVASLYPCQNSDCVVGTVPDNAEASILDTISCSAMRSVMLYYDCYDSTVSLVIEPFRKKQLFQFVLW
jgi:hypothetical protein